MRKVDYIMTKREGAILSAFTNILLCNDYDEYHRYIEEIMGRDVDTHEIPMLKDEVKLRATNDFKSVMESQID